MNIYEAMKLAKERQCGLSMPPPFSDAIIFPTDTPDCCIMFYGPYCEEHAEPGDPKKDGWGWVPRWEPQLEDFISNEWELSPVSLSEILEHPRLSLRNVLPSEQCPYRSGRFCLASYPNNTPK